MMSDSNQPASSHADTHPSQWTHFKSKKEKRADKKAKKKVKHKEKSADHPKTAQSHHTKPVPTQPEHPPIHFSTPKKHRRNPFKKLSSNAPFLIIFASLGIILIAVGAYLFKDNITNNLPTIIDLQLDQPQQVKITKQDIAGYYLVTTNGKLQKFNPTSGQLSPVDDITAAIPGKIVGLYPNPTHDIYYIYSTAQGPDQIIYRHFILNLATQQLLPITNKVMNNQGQQAAIGSAVWSIDGSKLLVTTAVENEGQDTSEFQVVTLDPNDLSTQHLTMISAEKVRPLYMDSELAALETIDTVDEDDEVKEIRKILNFDLAKKKTSVAEADYISRLPSSNGAHYASQNGNTIVFTPYNQNQNFSPFQVTLPAGNYPIKIIWQASADALAIITRDSNRKQSINLYTNDGQAIHQLDTELGANLIFSESGEQAIVSSNESSQNSIQDNSQQKSVFTISELQVSDGTLKQKQQLTANNPFIWSWTQ